MSHQWRDYFSSTGPTATTTHGQSEIITSSQWLCRYWIQWRQFVNSYWNVSPQTNGHEVRMIHVSRWRVDIKTSNLMLQDRVAVETPQISDKLTTRFYAQLAHRYTETVIYRKVYRIKQIAKRDTERMVKTLVGLVLSTIMHQLWDDKNEDWKKVSEKMNGRMSDWMN